MTAAKIAVRFNIHVAPDRVSSLVSIMAAYGNVHRGVSDREFVLEAFRASKMPKLRALLAHWEVSGFLKWREDILN